MHYIEFLILNGLDPNYESGDVIVHSLCKAKLCVTVFMMNYILSSKQQTVTLYPFFQACRPNAAVWLNSEHFKITENFCK